MNKKTSLCWILFFLTLNIINGSNSEFFSPPFSEETAPQFPAPAGLSGVLLFIFSGKRSRHTHIYNAT